MDAIQTPALNVKTKWWIENKERPEIVACMREARKKYYYANRDKEKARSLARYYAIKALTNPPAVPGTNVPDTNVPGV